MPPYTVYWFWNTSGIFGTGSSQVFLGTGEILNLSSHPNCPFFWVKCVVVSSDNVSISRIQKVTVHPCLCTMDHRPSRSRDPFLNPVSSQRFTIFPNPTAQNQMLVQSKEAFSEETVAYDIIDVWGRKVLDGNGERINEKQLSLPVENLSEGFYLLNILLPDGTKELHKFIISKT